MIKKIALILCAVYSLNACNSCKESEYKKEIERINEVFACYENIIIENHLKIEARQNYYLVSGGLQIDIGNNKLSTLLILIHNDNNGKWIKAVKNGKWTVIYPPYDIVELDNNIIDLSKLYMVVQLLRVNKIGSIMYDDTESMGKCVVKFYNGHEFEFMYERMKRTGVVLVRSASNEYGVRLIQ